MVGDGVRRVKELRWLTSWLACTALSLCLCLVCRSLSLRGPTDPEDYGDMMRPYRDELRVECVCE